MIFQERRQYPRFGIDIRVNFKRIKDKHIPAETPKIPGIVRNLGISGACFILDESFNEGELLYLEIYLPAVSQPIRAEGEVRWSRPFMNQDVSSMFETGIRIRNINEDDTARFETFTKDRLNNPHQPRRSR